MGVVDLRKWHDYYMTHNVLDKKRLALISISRGSFFAYKLIAGKIPYKAWINWSGVVGDSMVDERVFRENPVPALVLHGKKDKQCPVSWAYNLEKAYQSAGVPFEMKIFPKEGHIFSREATLESRRLMRFF
jgi:dienelactone hydrolase